MIESTGIKKIRLYWRGELKTVDEIYKNVEIHISNPFYVHALYDIYFKFLMATLYYEYRITIEYVQFNYALIPSERQNTAFITCGLIKYPTFSENIHPQKLAKAFNLYEFSSIQTILNNDENYIVNLSDFIEIENTIREFGIVIDLVLPKRKFNYSQDDVSPEYWKTILKNINKATKKYNRIFDNINKALKDATDEFLKFRTFYNTYINWEVTTTPTTTK